MITKCEKVGKEINDVLSIWASVADTGTVAATPTNGSGSATPIDTGGVNIVAVDVEAMKTKAEANGVSDAARTEALKDYMSTQPSLLAEGVVLKDYQLLGINWLSLLHRKKLSCILADEMGSCSGGSVDLSAESELTDLSRSRQDYSSHRFPVRAQRARYERSTSHRRPVSISFLLYLHLHCMLIFIIIL